MVHIPHACLYMIDFRLCNYVQDPVANGSTPGDDLASELAALADNAAMKLEEDVRREREEEALIAGIVLEMRL